MSIFGLINCDMLNSNVIWTKYLKHKGFKKHDITEDFPLDYTVSDFCFEHPTGVYVIGTGTHAVAVIDGDYYDMWDSGEELPLYYFEKE